MTVKITTLIENNSDNPSLHSEHGLSFYIQVDNTNIIFDTGQSGKFIENADKLNIDLKQTDYVILSHGHYDHSGGFISLIKEILIYKNNGSILKSILSHFQLSTSDFFVQ